MAALDFKKDIVLGELGEKIVINDLISMGAEFINDNKNNKYDVLIRRKGIDIKYEIKTDVKVSPKSDTGNIFIEKECRGKLSGIEVTEADWFVMYLFFFDEIWYIKTDKLKKLIKDNDLRMAVGGDPGSKSTGYLINRKKYRHEFIIRQAPASS
jgi:hypothetical protein